LVFTKHFDSNKKMHVPFVVWYIFVVQIPGPWPFWLRLYWKTGVFALEIF